MVVHVQVQTNQSTANARQCVYLPLYFVLVCKSVPRLNTRARCPALVARTHYSQESLGSRTPIPPHTPTSYMPRGNPDEAVLPFSTRYTVC